MAKFRKMKRTTYDAIPEQRRLEKLHEFIAPQLESAPFVPDPGRLREAPSEVQAVYWIWRFIADAEGGGLEVFLLNRPDVEVIGTHNALTAIAAPEFVQLYKAGIGVARTRHAEFTRNRNPWFEQFASPAEFERLRDIDRQIKREDYKDLRRRCLQFVAAHAASFFD